MSDLVKMSDIINIYNTYDSEEAREQVIKLPSINAVIIPDNATNGDMIKALFPTFEVKDLDPIILEQNYPKPFCKMQFDRKWWNAPYKNIL